MNRFFKKIIALSVLSTSLISNHSLVFATKWDSTQRESLITSEYEVNSKKIDLFGTKSNPLRAFRPVPESQMSKYTISRIDDSLRESPVRRTIFTYDDTLSPTLPYENIEQKKAASSEDNLVEEKTTETFRNLEEIQDKFSIFANTNDECYNANIVSGFLIYLLAKKNIFKDILTLRILRVNEGICFKKINSKHESQVETLYELKDPIVSKLKNSVTKRNYFNNDLERWLALMHSIVFNRFPIGFSTKLDFISFNSTLLATSGSFCNFKLESAYIRDKLIADSSQIELIGRLAYEYISKLYHQKQRTHNINISPNYFVKSIENEAQLSLDLN